MSRQITTLSLPDWIIKDIIGETDNRSARIQELLMKGHLYEKDKQGNQTFKNENQSQTNIMREYVNPVRSPLFFDNCNQDAI